MKTVVALPSSVVALRHYYRCFMPLYDCFVPFAIGHFFSNVPTFITNGTNRRISRMFFDQFEWNSCHSSIGDIRDKKLSGSEFENGGLHFVKRWPAF